MPENIPAQDAQAITLREHLEGRISTAVMSLTDAIRSVEESSIERQAALRREIELVQKSTKEAVDKAEEAQQLRNEAQNEWRQTVTQIISKYVEQRQIEALENTLRSKIEAVDNALVNKMETAEKSLSARLTVLERKESSQTGKMQGANWIIGLGIALVGICLALFGLIIRFVFAK